MQVIFCKYMSVITPYMFFFTPLFKGFSSFAPEHSHPYSTFTHFNCPGSLPYFSMLIQSVI